MSFATAKTAAIVREFKLPVCSNCPVEIPVATVTSHLVAAGSTALATVRVSVAVEAPEFDAVLANVVLPHKVVTGVDNVVNTSSGRTNVISSPTVSWVLHSNRNDNDVAVDVDACVSNSNESVNAGSESAGDD